jgi:hypothetical protein
LEHLEANLDQQHLLELDMQILVRVVVLLVHLIMKVVLVVVLVAMVVHTRLEFVVVQVDLDLLMHIALDQTNQEQVAVAVAHGQLL